MTTDNLGRQILDMKGVFSQVDVVQIAVVIR